MLFKTRCGGPARVGLALLLAAGLWAALADTAHAQYRGGYRGFRGRAAYAYEYRGHYGRGFYRGYYGRPYGGYYGYAYAAPDYWGGYYGYGYSQLYSGPAYYGSYYAAPCW
jgi:hypothetical protein